MGERRQPRSTDEPESSALPTSEAFADAYRIFHNGLAWLQSLAVMEQAAEVMAGAAAQYGRLTQGIGEAEQQQEQIQGAITMLKQEQQALAADYQRQREQAQAAHQEYLQALQAEADALEEPLEQQRTELGLARAEAQNLKMRMMTDAQRAGQVERIKIQTELAALTQQKAGLAADILSMEQKKSELAADLNSMLQKLGTIG
jgi:chromosome segregation ATPase